MVSLDGVGEGVPETRDACYDRGRVFFLPIFFFSDFRSFQAEELLSPIKGMRLIPSVLCCNVNVIINPFRVLVSCPSECGSLFRLKTKKKLTFS